MKPSTIWSKSAAFTMLLSGVVVLRLVGHVSRLISRSYTTYCTISAFPQAPAPRLTESCQPTKEILVSPASPCASRSPKVHLFSERVAHSQRLSAAFQRICYLTCRCKNQAIKCAYLAVCTYFGKSLSSPMPLLMKPIKSAHQK